MSGPVGETAPRTRGETPSSSEAVPVADPGIEHIEVVRYSSDGVESRRRDWASVEAPLEIRLAGEPLATTMRTPGHDIELAAGFLLAEGVITNKSELGAILPCGRGCPSNVVDVIPTPGTSFDFERRLTLTSSACGLCGRQQLEHLSAGRAPLTGAHVLRAATVTELSASLRDHQTTFERTGGLHAAGLGYADGSFFCVREDIGRHNAVDKAVGRALLDDTLSDAAFALVVSGRASFEIVYKAWLAAIPLVIAVSAPSSLAIEAARRANITLIGFARGDGFNVYTHPQRIIFPARPPDEGPDQHGLA